MKYTLLINFLPLFTLLSCAEIPIKNNEFFNESDNCWTQESYIKRDSLISNDTLYGFKVWFYDGKPAEANYLTGTIYKVENIIYFISEVNNLKFVLFDFSLMQGNCRNIGYSRQVSLKVKDTVIVKNYVMQLDTKFHDPLLNDTIYKFIFQNYEVFSKSNEIHYFVGIRAGIVGCFLIEKGANGLNDYIIGDFIGNVYSQKFDYSKYEFKTIK